MCKHRTYNSNLFQYSAPKMSKLKEISLLSSSNSEIPQSQIYNSSLLEKQSNDMSMKMYVVS